MRKILSLFAAVLFAVVANATVTNISPTSPYDHDALRQALYYATSGDTIVMAAGTYDESNSNFIAFDKDIVVKAAEGAEVIVLPRVQAQITNGARAEIIGIRFDADSLLTKDTWYNGIFAVADASEGNCLILDNCALYNCPKNAICSNGSTSNKLDSCIVRNCYFFNNAKGCVYLLGPVAYAEVTNCTFANIGNGGGGTIDVRGENVKLRVDHCTFYNCQDVNSDYGAIGYRTNPSTDVQVSNCIFMMPESYSVGRAIYLGGGVVKNCLTYNYTKDSTPHGIHSGPSITDCVEADPLFANAANADFHLGEGSPALAAGTEGSNLGDPRWWPAAPVPPTPQPAEISWNWADSSYVSASELAVVWSGDDVTLTLAKGTSQTAANNYLGGTGSYVHTRVYQNQTLTFAPVEGVTIESIEITATSNDYAGKFKNSTWTNASASTSGSTVTVTPVDGASAVVCTITAATRATAVKVTYLKGAAPAVAKPAIAGEEFFYDTTLVTITCATEGAAIYYTLDGTEPTSASTQYTAAFKLNATATVKAIAILGDDASAVVEAQFTKNPSFASFEALIAAELASNTLVEVSFADIVIDSIYVSSQTVRKGVYFTVGEKAYEIYYSNGDAAVPAEWVAGGKVSGTIRGNWTEYKGLWEIVPTAPWAWDKLTYAAPVEGCDWDNIEFLGGPAEYANQFKVCVGNPAPTQVVNIQQPGWATELGIFMSFPAAPITAVSLGEGKYAVDGAGCVLYVSAFTAKETEVTITANNVDYVVTVLNVNGTDPVVGATNYYLVGSMNNWTPGLTDDFVQNPGSEGEYMAKATLAVGDEFKVIGITSGVLNPDTTWYPGLAPNYIVDVDHAGAAKNIYFRPDGQGGEGWHYGVIFVEPNQDALKAVSDSTTWNFSKLTQDTLNSLYNKSDDAIKLSGETTPSTADELIYANYDSLWTIAAEFDGEAIAFTGQYPIRKNQFCQNGVLRIKTTVAGNIYVKFSDTGSKASETAVKRYLMVNGDSTEYWASREKTGEGAYPAQLNVETGAIPVPAGDVTIKGSSAIVVYYVTFVPDAAPIVNYYVAGSMNGWKADENYMLTPNNESLYEGEFTFAANDAFKVIGYDGSNTTWYPEGMGNDFQITEAGDYKITFNPAGNVEGWYAGFFNVVKKEEPVAPTTAPAAPTAAEDDVMAIYCNHYATNNLHFEILGWGGVTTWHADTIDGVAIVHCQDMSYEFLTNRGAPSYDFSAYKKLHLDIWVPQASSVRVGIEALGANEGGSGYKNGVVCTLTEGWNSIDITLAEAFENYDLKDVKYIFYEWYNDPEGQSLYGTPFGFANIYFYEKAPEGIENLFVEGKAVKVLYNGQILILKNNKVYTVTGQPVNMK